ADIACECDKDLIFDGCDEKWFASHSNASGGWIYPEFPNGDGRFARYFLLLRCLNRAPQDGSKTSKKFSSGERLGQIVVGSDFKPGDSIRFIAKRAQHQDRHRRLFPNFS